MEKIIKNSLLNLFIVLLFLFNMSTVVTSCSNSSDDDTERVEEEEKEEVDDPCPSGKIFNEKDGIVRVDLKNTSITANGWTTANTLIGFEGSGYLVWTGNDNFSTPGIGILKFSIKINTPGTYQFVWSSRIAQGSSNTDFNDSWLRIPTANDFYGEKANGARVYPKGSGKTPVPEGAGSNGWFKVYMNRVGEWFWRSSTSDNDPHNIFARFDAAGTYDIEISGRSKSHAIDQFVLFKIDKNLSTALSTELSEIICK
jgi:hypothetical protein